MDEEEYVKMKKLCNEYWWFKGKQDIVRYLIKKYKPYTRNVLDIGCGTGYFFDEYNGIGIEPCGIFERDNILNCKIENVKIKDKFDTIICLDVLEHLKDDTVIKKFIENNLVDNGLAIITVPAHKKLFNHHDEINNHYRRYEYMDLVMLLGQYGVDIYYYNSLLYPIEYLIRKFSKGDNNLKKLPKWLNLLLFYIFKLEKYLYKFFPTGMSLIAIVQKDGRDIKDILFND